jgi:triacylglycerol lipase
MLTLLLIASSQGSSADPMWDMSYIVQTSVANGHPIIGVSINYRLSFLGFSSGKEPLVAGVTNLGLKDQRIAMEWIQENIQAFGGDQRRVTIVRIGSSAYL